MSCFFTALHIWLLKLTSYKLTHDLLRLLVTNCTYPCTFLHKIDDSFFGCFATIFNGLRSIGSTPPPSPLEVIAFYLDFILASGHQGGN